MDLMATALSVAKREIIRKTVEKGVRTLYEKSLEKVRTEIGLEKEINKNIEKLYPGLGRLRLPDALAHFEHLDLSPQEIAAERRPEKLAEDVSRRMWNEGLTPQSWKSANLEGRQDMLLKAKEIMGQEMLLSPEFRAQLQLDISRELPKLGETTGVAQEVGNNLIEVSNPKITLQQSLLETQNHERAFGTLYHEMIHAMQYDALSETMPYSEKVQHFKDAVRADMADGRKVESRTIYLGDPREADAHMQEAFFKEMFQAICEEGGLNDAEGSLSNAEVLFSEQKEIDTFAPEMHVQAERIKEVFAKMPELQYQTWQGLTVEQRADALNNFESEIAKIEKREALHVQYQALDKGTQGYYDGQKIVLSDNLLRSNSYASYKDAMNTLFHEGRHAYQNHNLRIARTETSEELIKSWKANLDILGYDRVSRFTSARGYWRYYTQPIETDARLFAETVETAIGI